MHSLLRWDISECTDAPEGHVGWDAPRDGDARSHRRAHATPLDGLPCSLARRRHHLQPRDTTENTSTSPPHTWHQVPIVRCYYR
jgi:hypothetical protein